jgi:hypothetical protein
VKDYGNDPDWFTDRNGNRYHQKPTARRLPEQPTDPYRQMSWLYGPGTGKTDRISRKVDKLFDGIITVIVVAVGATVAFGMLGILRAPEPAQTPERDTIECSR